MWDWDLKLRSIYAHARCIRAFCNALVRDELLEKSPFSKGTNEIGLHPVTSRLSD